MPTTSKPPVANDPAQQKPLSKAAHTELVAVNFQVPPNILAKKVPKGLELDYYNDETSLTIASEFD